MNWFESGIFRSSSDNDGSLTATSEEIKSVETDDGTIVAGELVWSCRSMAKIQDFSA